jgi:hypothetical protein
VNLLDKFLANDHFLGGLSPFYGGCWHWQFGIVVVADEHAAKQIKKEKNERGKLAL